jgi:hypothetical protein
MDFLGLELLEAWELASPSLLCLPGLLLRFTDVMVMLLEFGWAVQEVCIRPWQIQRRIFVRLSEAGGDGLWRYR